MLDLCIFAALCVIAVMMVIIASALSHVLTILEGRAQDEKPPEPSEGTRG